MASLEAGWEAVKETWSDPNRGASAVSSLSDYYDKLEAYYNNTAYAAWGKLGAMWEDMKGERVFYRYHRTILNPTFRLVKFYRDSIYKGQLTLDGENLPDGSQRAIPFAEGTKKQLKLAVAQCEEWSGWQNNMLRLTTNTAKLGNIFAEIIDRPWEGKVVIKLWKPHYIKEIRLDEAGNPKYVCIEYKITERNAEGRTRTYLYRREMDTRMIRTFKNNEPYDYSNGATGFAWKHPYGFVPGRWFRHMSDELDSVYGLPAIAPALEKIDEMNEIVSQGHDQLSKIFNAPLAIKGARKPPGEDEEADTRRVRRRRRTSEKEKDGDGTKGKIEYVYVGDDGGVQAIELSMSEALDWVKHDYEDIENDLPELGFPRRLADMSELTGPAATRVLRDVVDAHLSVQANYDNETRRLFQMAVAICGYNLNMGVWKRYADQQGIQLTEEHEKFRPYNLDSYKKGDLDYTIMPRPLLTETKSEKWAARGNQAAAVATMVEKLQVPVEEGWEEMEFDPAKIKAWKAEAEKEKEARMAALPAALAQNVQAAQDGQQPPQQSGQQSPTQQAEGGQAAPPPANNLPATN